MAVYFHFCLYNFNVVEEPFGFLGIEYMIEGQLTKKSMLSSLSKNKKC